MLKEKFLFEQIPDRPFSHSAMIAQLSNGDLLSAFFAGQKEGIPDNAILTARLKHGSKVWSDVQVVVDTLGKPNNNPVLFVNARGVISLFYMTIDGILGPESCERTLMFAVKSTDGGHNWLPAQQVCTIQGWMLRNKPIHLKSGRILLPCYYENPFQWMGFCLYSDNEGETWKQSSWIKAPVDVIQPTLLERKDGSILALFRSRSPADRPDQHRIWRSVSKDEGYTWSRCEPTNLPNPNSGIDLVGLRNGHVILAYNDSETERTPLTLALSTDEGETWGKQRHLETEPGHYSYPAIIQSQDELIHVLYTWRNIRIKHVTVSEDWIGGAD
jgi:predicted neuraminidase